MDVETPLNIAVRAAPKRVKMPSSDRQKNAAMMPYSSAVTALLSNRRGDVTAARSKRAYGPFMNLTTMATQVKP